MNYWNKPRFVPKTQQNSLARNMPLVLPHKCTFSGRLEVYENLVKFTPGEYVPPNSSPPPREDFDIKDFSQKSRMKLFTMFNMLDYSQYGIPLFLSATWHYDQPADMSSIKSFLKKFRQMLDRKFPPFHYIWKLEYQQRGAPHFHILLFPLNPLDKFYSKENEKFIKEKWLKLKTCKCNYCKNFAIKTIQCETRLMSIAYISKEIAKVEDRYEKHDLGRIWGTSENMRIKKLDEIICSPKFFNQIINKKLEENFRKDFQKDYLLSLIDCKEPRSIFIDREKILDIIIKAKTENLPDILPLKKYSFKRSLTDFDLNKIKLDNKENLPDLIF